MLIGNSADPVTPLWKYVIVLILYQGASDTLLFQCAEDGEWL
jgi:hypothetical protein